MKTLMTKISLLLFCTAALSMEFGLRGQASTLLLVDEPETESTTIGLRYIPEISAHNLFASSALDAEFSANLYAAGNIAGEDGSSVFEPYRMWLRYSGDQFEARLGLQKINFGSALILRPLMWFDQLDPRDPLQITKGVYALLARYYFLNNANIWVWGIWPKQERKGLEVLPSEGGKPELGGRFQLPVPHGEVALSYHHRGLKNPEKEFGVPFPAATENRIALDGKWDYILGFWFEAVTQESKSTTVSQRINMINLGADYTFELGNGLHVLAEYFQLNASALYFFPKTSLKLTALVADYNLSLFDQLMGIVYWDQMNHEAYQFLSWRRTFDHWSCNINLFNNPPLNRLGGLGGFDSQNVVSGLGVMFMLIYNH